jgi:hypothetical protein
MTTEASWSSEPGRDPLQTGIFQAQRTADAIDITGAGILRLHEIASISPEVRGQLAPHMAELRASIENVLGMLSKE